MFIDGDLNAVIRVQTGLLFRRFQREAMGTPTIAFAFALIIGRTVFITGVDTWPKVCFVFITTDGELRLTASVDGDDWTGTGTRVDTHTSSVCCATRVGYGMRTGVRT